MHRHFAVVYALTMGAAFLVEIDGAVAHQFGPFEGKRAALELAQIMFADLELIELQVQGDKLDDEALRVLAYAERMRRTQEAEATASTTPQATL